MLAAGGGLLLLVVAAVLVFALAVQSPKHAAPPPQPTAKSVSAARTTPSTAQTPTAPAGTTNATPTVTTPATPSVSELASINAILTLAKNGRQDLANGDLTAAIANRRMVLQELRTLQPDAQLAPSVRALQTAESFSLAADQRCGLNCPAGVDRRATELKQTFVAIFAPVAKRYDLPTYSAGQI